MSPRQKRRRRVEALWRKRLQEACDLLNKDPFWKSAYMVDYGTTLQAFFKAGVKPGYFGLCMLLKAARKQTAAQLVFRMRRKADEVLIRQLMKLIR
jgi:hypothetical protein